MRAIVTILTLSSVISSSYMIRSGLAMLTTHMKCRGGVYPRSGVERFPVPDDRVSWTGEYREYEPRNYTSKSIDGKPWADPEIGDPDFKPNWNQLDGNINRASYSGHYSIVNGVPQNPIGRTGITGRGVLGRWGPNHAADPVVTRWKKLDSGDVALDANNKPVLQFVAIKRSDTGEWALPGGMVDPGERVAAAALREFQEEAVDSLNMSEDEKESWRSEFKKLFSEGDEVYRGYVDDRRNTDNAWMETVAYNFHDEGGAVAGALRLHAGDDAVGVRWVDISDELELSGSHEDIVREVLRIRLAVKSTL